MSVYSKHNSDCNYRLLKIVKKCVLIKQGTPTKATQGNYALVVLPVLDFKL